MDKFPADLRELHDSLIPLSEQIIHAAETGELASNPAKFKPFYEQIEAATLQKNTWLKTRISHWKSRGKWLASLAAITAFLWLIMIT